jgi:hypothetical protein
VSKRDKIRIGGHEFEVMTQADLLRARTAPVKPLQVCARVADVDPSLTASARHARERLQLPCEECNTLCWFDPASGPGRLFVRLVCIQCATEVMRRMPE